MSIKSEITRITANVSDSFVAVKESGFTVSSATKSANLPTAIRSVNTSINDLLDQINGKEI